MITVAVTENLKIIFFRGQLFYLKRRTVD